MVVPYKNQSKGKKEQVADMFNSISPKYDFLNHLLSGGIDIIWRKKAIKLLQNKGIKSVLDIATGTGDFAIEALKIKPEKIVGIDISEGMLDLGRKKIAKLGLQNSIELQKGDSEAINFPDASFDAITVAFGVRNFENLLVGLQEMHRVLQSNGKLVVLEFSKPQTGLFKYFYQFYMRFIAPGFVQLFSSDKQAYEYLNESVAAFPEGKNFTQIMVAAGFHNVYQKKLTFGICSIYCGTK